MNFMELIPHIMIAIGSGAGVYAAIKSDLTRAIMTAESAAKSASRAHERLDIHIEQHHNLKQ